MAEFARGYQVGQQSSGLNPFSALLEAVNKAASRRYDEDKERQKEHAELRNYLIKLGMKHEYDKSLLEKEAEIETKSRKDELRQETINKGYQVAQDIMEAYLDNPDPNDEDVMSTARSLGAQAFDNYMKTSGYEDITFLNASESMSGDNVQATTQKSTTDILGLTKSTLPKTATPEERLGETTGKVAKAAVSGIGKIPSRIAGAAGSGFNLLQGTARGLTGVGFKGIPQEYLNVMQKGKLFDVPTALNFYANLLNRTKNKEIKR